MKILVVDDHGYNRELLGFILEDNGHDTVYAENGQIACDKVLEDHDIGLILMDVMMPVMDGLDATRKIKADSGERFLPVLFVTALDDEKNITACLESGGDDFVPKPVSESVLIAKVNAHTRSKLLYDNLRNANEELTYHRKMMDREHTIVERIFNNGSARVTTRCQNVDVYTSPMSMFNGDLILVAPSPTGGVYGLVGDFTGHGLAASIGTLPVTEVFFQHVTNQGSVSQLAYEINSRLKILLPSNMFFCAAIFELDFRGENMTLWLGGMNDVISVSADGKTLQRLESAHMPLGILSDEEFDDSPRVISLEHGSRWYIYTDGITEAHNAEKEEFGQERLEDILFNVAENTLEYVVKSVNEFSDGGGQSDDVSMLAFHAGKIVHVSKETNEVVDVGSDYHYVDSIPWSLKMTLSDEDLKSTSVVDQVMSFVSSIKGIVLHQDKIFTIVSELYNNALEHGVLRLDSKLKSSAEGFEQYYSIRQQRLDAISGQSIEIHFCYLKGEPNRLQLTLQDSGDGFDIAAVMAATNSDDDSHGRGLQLLKLLCSSLEYSNAGRTVVATYDLCQH